MSMLLSAILSFPVVYHLDSPEVAWFASTTSFAKSEYSKRPRLVRSTQVEGP